MKSRPDPLSLCRTQPPAPLSHLLCFSHAAQASSQPHCGWGFILVKLFTHAFDTPQMSIPVTMNNPVNGIRLPAVAHPQIKKVHQSKNVSLNGGLFWKRGKKLISRKEAVSIASCYLLTWGFICSSTQVWAGAYVETWKEQGISKHRNNKVSKMWVISTNAF